MKLRYRDGRLIGKGDGQERLLGLLYGNCFGRVLLKMLTRPAVSKAAGWFLSSRVSCLLIGPFVQKHGIRLEEFEPDVGTAEKKRKPSAVGKIFGSGVAGQKSDKLQYHSYNEFFSRKIRPELRPINQNPQHLISPCDSKLTVLPITQKQRFTLKHTGYTVASLLRNKQLAREFEGGYAMIFRLTVDDYHRYCYVADGSKSENVRIPGVFHTVNPIANDYFPIYKENAREYTVLQSSVFGKMIQMEVGALLVGKIVNHHGKSTVRRGQEKGYFQFGGSTVVLLVKAGVVQVDEDILENSRAGIETVVKMGEKIGSKKSIYLRRE